METIIGWWTTLAAPDPRWPRFSAVLIAAGIILWAVPAQAVIFVTGRVVGKDSGTPVAGATVALYRPGQSSSEDPVEITQSLMNGSYLLKAPEAGSYRVVVRQGDYVPMGRSVEVPSKGLASLDLPVERQPTVMLRLVGPDGRPVTRGMLEVAEWVEGSKKARGIRPISTPAPPNGIVNVAESAALSIDGGNELRIAVRDAAVGCGEVQLKEWPDSPIPLQLQPGGTVIGKLFDARARPAANQVVTATFIRSDDGIGPRRMQARATTDEEGKFRLPALVAGEYVLRVDSTGEGTVSRVIHVTGGQTQIALGLSGGPADHR